MHSRTDIHPSDALTQGFPFHSGYGVKSDPNNSEKSTLLWLLFASTWRKPLNSCFETLLITSKMRPFTKAGWMLRWLNEEMFGLKACSAAVISHHPVPSGRFRLAWECSYNSGVGLGSPFAGSRTFEASDSPETESLNAQLCLYYVKVLGFVYFAATSWIRC